MTATSSRPPDSEITVSIAPPPRRGRWRLRMRLEGWAFVLPAAVVLLALSIFPLIFSLALSFSNVSQDNGLTFTTRTRSGIR